MVIGFDLDDTITNSSDTFVKYAKKYNAENNIDYRININELDCEKAFGWTKKQKEEFLNLYLEAILMESVPRENAVDVINRLYNCGNKIIIITARSNTEINNMYELTKTWLEKHRIKYNKLVINSKQKHQDCLNNNVSIFVDDNYTICENSYEKLKIPIFIFNTRYNMNYNNIRIKRIYNWNEMEELILGTNSNNKTKEKLEYIDIDNRDELPPVPKGSRYIHFYGGTKNYRAYIAPESISRADFMEKYPEYIPEQNQPIYEHNGIIVRADPKFPCPGFYIFALNKTYRSFDLLDDITFIRFCFILKKIKEGMKSELKINYAHLLSNEKSDPFVNVHFWLVPVNGKTSPDLLDFDVKQYLKSFEPKKEVDKIIRYNNKLKEYIERIHLKELDDELANKLKLKQ